MRKTSKLNRYFFPGIMVVALMFFSPFAVKAQSEFKGLENLFTPPRSYVIHYVQHPPLVDGDINDDVWKQAQWTDEFQDIEGDIKPHPFLQTKVKMLWGDTCLYIAAQIQEPNVWAYVKHHDEIVFHDNDFEVFINPNNTTHQYFEVEVNAINTIFDLFLNKPYRDYGTALFNWNVEGLQSAIKVQGTLNNPSDTDKGWTVEMAIPFRAISIGNYVNIPREGTFWRINFSRVEWDTKAINGKYEKLKDENGERKPEHNWVWSAQGQVDMHCPDRWGYLQFTKSNTDTAAFKLPYNEQQRKYLWLIYYREQLWLKEHNKYALSLKELGINNTINIGNRANALKLEATDHQFMGFITDEQDKITWTINQEGLARQLIAQNE